jgi:DNA-binding transcriptional LysR family regulator
MLPATVELRLLRSFVAVAEAGSLTRAAEGLRISQQSLSQQMRLLEAQAGAPLLERSSRGVALTRVGAVLLGEARAVLERADRLAANVERAARGVEGTVRVGLLASVANYLMPPLVRTFAERHPRLELLTEDGSIAELVGALRAGRLDAALTRPPLVDDLETEVLLREPVAAVLPEGHRLADRGELELGELAEEPWVLTPRSAWPPWHAKYDADFAAAGFAPRVVRRAGTPQALLALVAAGVGVTRLTLSARSLRDSGVVFVPLRGESASVVLCTNSAIASPALPALRAVLAEVVRTTDLAASG